MKDQLRKYFSRYGELNDKKMLKRILLTLTATILLAVSSMTDSIANQIDVISYHLAIEPNIDEGAIKGSVSIKLLIKNDLDSISLDAGNLKIDKVKGSNVERFKKRNQTLIIYLSKRSEVESQIVIEYHGKPTYGLIFDLENKQAYTIYNTSQWMVCNDIPEDKALFYLDITVPTNKTCIASGELITKTNRNETMLYSFRLDSASPSYTYGFAIGNFNEAEEKHKAVSLKYYSPNHTSEQLAEVFKETPAMMSFFEEKSGIGYFQSAYSQVLTGKYYQEMSGLSMLKESYGKMVLEDSTETNLISHELSHQWWGNQITCKDWGHFWLNEGMATFMSAAYNEYRFGQSVYLSNIESYFNVYEEIKKRGNDRSLVFENWNNPSRDDRNLVYFKGAYIFHLLKEKLGNEAFWEAIKFYSIRYNGKSVETADLQKAFEESSGIKLDEFFDEWIYANKD